MRTTPDAFANILSPECIGSAAHTCLQLLLVHHTYSDRFAIFSLQVSLDKSDALVAKNASGLSRIRVKQGCFSRKSRIRRPTIVRVIEGPTYRSPTYRGTPVPVQHDTKGEVSVQAPNIQSPYHVYKSIYTKAAVISVKIFKVILQQAQHASLL